MGNLQPVDFLWFRRAETPSGVGLLLGQSKLINKLSLHKERPVNLRPHVLPYSILYLIVVGLDVAEVEIYSWLLLPILLFFHAFLFLLTLWNTDAEALLNYSSASLANATFVKVSPKRYKGVKMMCPIQMNKDSDGQVEVCFYYQKRKYILVPSEGKFQKISFPVAERLSFYRDAQGPSTEKEMEVSRRIYGRNIFDIPMPSFSELYKEQAMQPFFVFQVFCFLLWCLDDYFYYSLFTLVMLLFFEAIMTRSRMVNMKIFRNMTIPDVEVQVRRNGAWSTIKSSDLVPGDLIVIKRSEAETVLACDVLLLSGTCIMNEAMLTGESTPQMKEPISIRDANDTLNLNQDKLHVLFAGTRLIKQSPEDNKLAPRGQGCIGYVLRTGFNTGQGKLVRTILYSSERVTENNVESFAFIFFLLIFAILAAGYVMIKGLEDLNRSRWKLLLECTLIITRIVPLDLPMQLSLAVNTSLMNLAKQGIFCTEPFRIPFSGKSNICAFDKTGTLVHEHLVMKGVLLLGQEANPGKTVDEIATNYIAPGSLPDVTQMVMSGCQSLAVVNNDLVGDPMEITALRHVGWSITVNDVVESKRSQKFVIRIRHRFHFSSALKRMSTVVSLDHESKPTFMALVKGAPETIQHHLKTVPEGYVSLYKQAARRGGRVIALASKLLDSSVVVDLHNLKREEVESDLDFAGFVVFECPLKSDSHTVIKHLKDSSHTVIMITGDNPLTACEVSRQLKMTEKPTLILTEDENTKQLSWVSVDETTTFPFQTPLQSQVATDFDLCITGTTLSRVLDVPNRKDAANVMAHARIFARASPEQKTAVLAHYKREGHGTLMCGDGTNDVGALKQADVGVALLLNASDPRLNLRVPGQPGAVGPAGQPAHPASASASSAATRQRKKTGTGKKDTAGKPAAATPATATAPTQAIPPRPRNMTEAMEQLKKQMDDMDAADRAPIVQLGDASIAAPFTSRGSSIAPILNIIRQGRCTLVTTLQMFKILALNCLISGYSMSVLYLEGVKYGETQATIIGMLTAFIFLCISRSQPLDKLSPQRPVSKVFSLYMILSLLGQFAVHMICMIYVVDLAEFYREGLAPLSYLLSFTPLTHYYSPKLAPDAPFAANIINSAIFLISTSMQISTFAINYQGHPFMQSIRENKGLMYCLVAVSGITVLAASEIMPEFNVGFELVLLPWDFRWRLITAMVVDYIGAWVWEIVIKALCYRA